MSDPFLTKIIIYLILVFLVWEQLGPHELKSQTAAQLLPEQEVSSLKRIARKLMIEDIDEFNASVCIKKNVSQPAPEPPECSDQRKSEVRCANRPINALSFIAKINCTCYPRDGNSFICHVKELDWSSKGLNEHIPEEFRHLTHLESLDWSSNKLEGSIPDIWENMSSLYMLNLSDNKLTGKIPKNLENMKPRIEEQKSGKCIRFQLDLSHNQLEGLIPDTFGDLEKNLAKTKQSLKPSSSCDFSSFLIILDGNLLNGTIPTSLSKITYLRRLSVSDNQLSGQILEELGLLKFLEELWLDSNNFTGRLPTTFSQLKKLEYLGVVGNNFWGNIPPEILRKPHLRYLKISDLANSSFQFPKSLNWTNTSFEVLILRNCSINGSIPDNIGLIPNLYELDFSFNKLTGLIPSSLRTVSRFQYLSLAENKLRGTIPEWIFAAANESIYGL